MPVYVDNGRIPYRGMLMAHMLADTTRELHAMASRIGLKREWFQNHGTPHYDICQSKRAAAIRAGAIIIGRRELVAMIRRLRSRTAADERRPPQSRCKASGHDPVRMDPNLWEEHRRRL